MSSTDRSRAARVPLRRLALWLIVVAALLAGVVLFFRFGRDIVPALGGGQ